MRYSVMINALQIQCIRHFVSGAAPEEELPSSVMQVDVEERAATGPPILSHHNTQHPGGAQPNGPTEDVWISDECVTLHA